MEKELLFLRQTVRTLIGIFSVTKLLLFQRHAALMVITFWKTKIFRDQGDIRTLILRFSLTEKELLFLRISAIEVLALWKTSFLSPRERTG
jgi:hypothetical protein